jgi:dipeptidyl aminopeptidase/acylaminoacyl peptidase
MMARVSSDRNAPRRPTAGAVFLAVVLLAALPGRLDAQTEEGRQPYTVSDLLDLRSLSVQDITEDGTWLVCTTSQRRSRLHNDYTRYGDPTFIGPGGAEVFILNGMTGEQSPLFEEMVQARGFTWSPDGNTLAFLLLKEDAYRLHTWDRERNRLREVRLKTDKPIATTSLLEWLPDGSGLLLELREEGWAENARREFEELTDGPIIVHDSREPFLRWDAIRNLNGLTVPASVELRSRDVTELLPEADYGSLRLARDGSFLTFVQTYPLATTYTNRGRAEYELSFLDLQNGETRAIREKSDERPPGTWNRAGDRFAFTKKGDVLVRSVIEEEPINLTESGRPYHDESDTARVQFSPRRFSPDGDQILCSTQQGYWLVDTSSGDVERIYTFEGDEETRPRLGVTSWSPDGRYLYLTRAARDRWERGLSRLDLRNGEMEDLVKDANLYRSWRFSEDGSTLYYMFSNGDLPNELYRTDPEFGSPTRLTDLNPWIMQRKLTRSELVTYLDVDGEELNGILYYPVDYEPGKKYPLVCEIYETFFDNGFNSNMNLLANAGFFGFRPSVHLETGYPGESWVKGITAGINKLIEKGMVDPEKLGVHGTSYGGYATALLVTQTPRFAAAINISGKVNMVSFYGDSPRLGVRNITAPERGQDRIGGSLWDYPERYIEHSAIMFADRIETPLMLITGDLDYNVPARQSMEMYYAMRRLEKDVVWVRYADGGHSPPNSAEQYDDFWNRIIGWYREHFDKVDEERAKKAKEKQ